MSEPTAGQNGDYTIRRLVPGIDGNAVPRDSVELTAPNGDQFRFTAKSPQQLADQLAPHGFTKEQSAYVWSFHIHPLDAPPAIMRPENTELPQPTASTQQNGEYTFENEGRSGIQITSPNGQVEVVPSKGPAIMNKLKELGFSAEQRKDFWPQLNSEGKISITPDDNSQSPNAKQSDEYTFYNDGNEVQVTTPDGRVETLENGQEFFNWAKKEGFSHVQTADIQANAGRHTEKPFMDHGAHLGGYVITENAQSHQALSGFTFEVQIIDPQTKAVSGTDDIGIANKEGSLILNFYEVEDSHLIAAVSQRENFKDGELTDGHVFVDYITREEFEQNFKATFDEFQAGPGFVDKIEPEAPAEPPNAHKQYDNIRVLEAAPSFGSSN